MADFAMRRVTKRGFDEVLALLPDLLRQEGFGVLTEIDVQATLKKKLDVDFRRYKILGACNPTFAHQALLAETDIGVMLPCNVAVYEASDGNTHVNAINPAITMAPYGNSRLFELGTQIGEKLARVLEKI